MQLPMNALFGQRIGKDVDFTHEFKAENWLRTEFDDRVENYHKIRNGGCFVKLKIDDDKCLRINGLPAALDAFEATAQQ